MAVTHAQNTRELPAEPARDFFPIRWAKSLRRKGIRGVVGGRWYVAKMKWADRYFNFTGNLIRAYGMKFSVDNPLIQTYQKIYLRAEMHESGEVAMVNSHLDAALPTVELGGSMGVVACLTNRKLDDPSAHVVVEANPLVVPTLQKNRDLNNAKFEILNAAVGYGGDSLEFNVGPDCLTGAVRGEGTQKFRVPTVSLREIVETRNYGAINLIVDIEGAEVDLVANELDVLKKHARFFLLETHERMLQDGSTPKMLAALKEAGFRILEGDPKDDPFVFAFVNDALAPASAPTA